MCLYIPYNNFLILAPDEEAKKWGKIVKILVIIHFVLAILWAIPYQFVSLTLDLITAFFGYMGVWRSEEFYNFNFILFYLIFVSINFFFSASGLILLLSQKEIIDQGLQLTEFQFVSYFVILGFAIVFYAISVYVLWRLIKELRRLFQDSEANIPYSQVGGTNHYVNRYDRRSDESGQFEPFSGQGRRLGDNDWV